MLVQFLDNDGGTEIFEEEREDISDLVNIFKNGGKFNYYVNQDYFFHGSLADIIFCVEPNPDNEEEMIDILKLYFDKHESMSSK